MLVDWVPQQAILNTTEVKLFFTHGGLHSYYEAVDSKKPMIIMPFNDEQQVFLCDFAHLEYFGSCVYSLSSANIKEAVNRAEKNDYYERKLN